jgi:hypothetical protein
MVFLVPHHTTHQKYPSHTPHPEVAQGMNRPIPRKAVIRGVAAEQTFRRQVLQLAESAWRD